MVPNVNTRCNRYVGRWRGGGGDVGDSAGEMVVVVLVKIVE